MSHLPTLITDLALILASAGLMTLIFKRLKQPSVLGYIVAGILAGPHITLTPTVIYPFCNGYGKYSDLGRYRGGIPVVCFGIGIQF